MNSRRNFLKSLGMAVGGVLLQEAIPFNRVWSFPSDIKIHRYNDPLFDRAMTIAAFMAKMEYDLFFHGKTLVLTAASAPHLGLW